MLSYSLTGRHNPHTDIVSDVAKQGEYIYTVNCVLRIHSDPGFDLNVELENLKKAGSFQRGEKHRGQQPAPMEVVRCQHISGKHYDEWEIELRTRIFGHIAKHRATKNELTRIPESMLRDLIRHLVLAWHRNKKDVLPENRRPIQLHLQ